MVYISLKKARSSSFVAVTVDEGASHTVISHNECIVSDLRHLWLRTKLNDLQWVEKTLPRSSVMLLAVVESDLDAGKAIMRVTLTRSLADLREDLIIFA